jgi:hypothetical protein
MYVQGNNEARSRILRCRRAISVTYSKRVFVALGIRHAKRMRPIILPTVACPTVPCFPHYVVKGKISGRKKLLNIKCVF